MFVSEAFAPAKTISMGSGIANFRCLVERRKVPHREQPEVANQPPIMRTGLNFNI